MEPVVSVVVILAAAVVVLKKVVNIVSDMVPAITGKLTILIAVVIGTLIAWFFDYQITELLFAEAGLPGGRDLPEVLDYVVAGTAMAGFAGYLHDREQAIAATSVSEFNANVV
jgi:hypothetical protein